jgi:hypothetical protein
VRLAAPADGELSTISTVVIRSDTASCILGARSGAGVGSASGHRAPPTDGLWPESYYVLKTDVGLFARKNRQDHNCNRRIFCAKDFWVEVEPASPPTPATRRALDINKHCCVSVRKGSKQDPLPQHSNDMIWFKLGWFGPSTSTRSILFTTAKSIKSGIHACVLA